MIVTTSILQLVLFVCIGTKFVHDIAITITDQCEIYLCSYIAIDLIPDPHNITSIIVMVAILVIIIVLVPMDKMMGKLVGNDR